MSALPVTTLNPAFPELAGIDNEALAEKWQDLKLQVVAVEITDATELEALEYTKALGLFKKDADAAKKAALEPYKAKITAIETPFKRLAVEIDKLDARRAELSTKETKQLQALQKQLDECREYHERLQVVAEQAISFDLDDGVVVNYAKFGDILQKIK